MPTPRLLVALAAVPAVALAFVVTADTAGQPKPAAPPPPAECRWAASPITIDGAADEPAWKAAQVIDNFRLPWLGKGDRPAKTATRARLLWDREFLYFVADMDDADLFADVTEHDGNTWDNDVFELFFLPEAGKPGYYEFQVNAAGTVFDCFFPKRDLANLAAHKKAGTFRVEQKVRLRGTLNQRDDVDRGWSVEGRIPWADFLRTGGRPTPGEEWRFTLCRYDYDRAWKAPELSATAPLQNRKGGTLFHQHEDYAPLKFVGPPTAGGPPPGIAAYVPVTTSTVVGSPDPPLPYRLTRVYPDLSPAFVINVRAVPGTDQMLLIGQGQSSGGTTLFRFRDHPEVQTADLVAVLDTPEKGTAYDIAFHPQFRDNGFVYIGWNGAPPKGTKTKTCRVTRYTMDRLPPYTLDPLSAHTIVEWPSDGHNGAAVCFGTDGRLYVTTGDGTSDSDTNVMGQNTDTLLSKVLRLDVDRPAAGKAYSVPPDNPFVADRRFAPETFAYGLRNPWRICCDEKTGRIWVGNNGQDLFEQAYLVRPGDNYGWSVMEGSRPFYPERKPGPTPIVKPTIEHSHAEFRSLTGGLVWHGDALPDLKGAYLYGDHSTGRVWGMLHDGTKPVWHRELARGPVHITAFGTNTRGQLLICDHAKAGEGGLYTLTPTPKDLPPSTFPKRLSDSGLFDAVKGHKLKPGVIPYSVNAPFWSDGLYKERAFALPPDGKISYTPRRGWHFPDKTVIVKSFAVEEVEGDPASRRWVETRFLTKQEGEWIGYTYLWNDAGTDADLVPAAGTDRTFRVAVPKSADHPAGVREQVWHYPSRAECMVCHSRAANYVLGLCSLQMNKTHDYGNGYADNQLAVYERLGLFDKPVNWAAGCQEGLKTLATAKGLTDAAAAEFAKLHGPHAGQRKPTPATAGDLPGGLPHLVNPYDKGQPLDLRARSFLHSNCASCHVEAGGGNARMELEFTTPADKMRLIADKPVHHPFGLPDPKLVAPGRPDESILLKRVGVRGQYQMPPIGSNRVDAAAVALLREWIAGMKE